MDGLKAAVPLCCYAIKQTSANIPACQSKAGIIGVIMSTILCAWAGIRISHSTKKNQGKI